MSTSRNRFTFDQRLALTDWLRFPGNPEKVRECPTDAQALAVAAQDLPWLTEDYLLAFRNTRKKLGVPTGWGDKKRAKQAAAKRAKETPGSLEERVSALEERLCELHRLVSELSNMGFLELQGNPVISREMAYKAFGVKDPLAEAEERPDEDITLEKSRRSKESK